MEQEQTSSTNTASILKELSDIKSSLAVNTNETANIKANISEIKQDIKDIKNDTVKRRELEEAIKNTKTELREEINPLKKIVFGVASVVSVAVLGALFKVILK